MPFSQDRFDELFADIRLALTSTQISDWERSFLRDMQTRLLRYGRHTRFTDKQYTTMMRLISNGARSAFVGHGRSNEKSRTRYGPKTTVRRSDWTTLLRIAVFGTVVAGFIVFMGAERFPENLGPIVSATSLGRVSGPVTRVRDGDTIEVSGTAIRFGSLDCAERGTPAGQKATAKIQSLVAGQKLQCFLNGRTSYDRKIGSCRLSDGRDLAAILIQEGYCGRFW